MTMNRREQIAEILRDMEMRQCSPLVARDRILSIGLEQCPLRYGKDETKCTLWTYVNTEWHRRGCIGKEKCDHFKAINAAIKGEGK